MVFSYYGALFNTELLSKEKKYYVYQIIDPRDNTVLYVGKGKGNRYKTHLKKSHNNKLNNIIQKIRSVGFEPSIKFSDNRFNLTESQAFMREVLEVRVLWNKNQCICNFAFPGPGMSNRTGSVHTEETKRKISESGKVRVLKESTREKHKKYHKERPRKHKENLILGKLNKSKFTESLIRVIRKRYVNDVHLTVPQIANELSLKSYEVSAIGQGLRYKEIAPETIPSKNLRKILISKRKSITSRINSLKRKVNENL